MVRYEDMAPPAPCLFTIVIVTVLGSAVTELYFLIPLYGIELTN